MFGNKNERFTLDDDPGNWHLLAPAPGEMRSTAEPLLEFSGAGHYPVLVEKRLALSHNPKRDRYALTASIRRSNYRADFQRQVTIDCVPEFAQELVQLARLAHDRATLESNFGHDGVWYSLLVAQAEAPAHLRAWCPHDDSGPGRLCTLFSAIAEEIARNDIWQHGHDRGNAWGRGPSKPYEGAHFARDIAMTKERFLALRKICPVS